MSAMATGAVPRDALGLAMLHRQRLEARATRAIVEAALDQAGWPWSRRLSRSLDARVILEESAP